MLNSFFPAPSPPGAQEEGIPSGPGSLAMHLTLFFLSPAMSPGFWAWARRHAHERSLPTPMKPAHVSHAAASSPWWSSAAPLFTHRPTGAVGPDAISCYTTLPGHNPRLCQRLSRNGGACPFLASRQPGGGVQKHAGRPILCLLRTHVLPALSPQFHVGRTPTPSARLDHQAAAPLRRSPTAPQPRSAAAAPGPGADLWAERVSMVHPVQSPPPLWLFFFFAGLLFSGGGVSTVPLPLPS